MQQPPPPPKRSGLAARMAGGLDRPVQIKPPPKKAKKREEWEAASAGGGIGAPPPLSEAVRCALDGAQERSDALVTALGLPKEAPLVVPHPLVGYAAVARGEAQLFVDLPPPGEFNAHAGAHAAGALIVHEAGGRVTDVKNNDVDHFSAASKIGDADADGLVVSNVDLHPPVVRTLMEA